MELELSNLGKDISLKIVETLDNLDLSYQIYTDNEILQKYKTEEEKIKMQDFIKNTFSDKTEIVFKKDLKKDIKDLNILKFNVMDFERPLLMKEARKEVEKIEGLEVTSSWNDNVEIMNGFIPCKM